MKYIKKFNEHNDFKSYIEGENYTPPNTSYCALEDEVHYPLISDFVDLGFSSQTLWSTCDIGSDSPYISGSTFRWGETKPHAIEENFSSFLPANSDYKHFGFTFIGNGGQARGNSNLEPFSYYKKYYPYNYDTTYDDYNLSDNKYILDEEDDAAAQNLGNDWVIPYPWQFVELFDNTSKTFNKETSSITLTSLINGNQITFPINHIEIIDGGYASAEYFTNSLYQSSPKDAQMIWIESYDLEDEEQSFSFGPAHDDRVFPHRIRPVRKGFIDQEASEPEEPLVS